MGRGVAGEGYLSKGGLGNRRQERVKGGLDKMKPGRWCDWDVEERLGGGIGNDEKGGVSNSMTTWLCD